MIVSTKLIFKGFAAFSAWPFIFVLPESRNDVGLIEHELVHYKRQRWITPVWIIAYFASRRFRMREEVLAYKRQIEVKGITPGSAADMLMTYRLGITRDQAMDALK